MCSVIAIQILDAVLFSSGNQNLPQSDQALIIVFSDGKTSSKGPAEAIAERPCGSNSLPFSSIQGLILHILHKMAVPPLFVPGSSTTPVSYY